MRAKIRNYYHLVLVGIRVIRDEGWRVFWRRFQHWRVSQRNNRWQGRPRASYQPGPTQARPKRRHVRSWKGDNVHVAGDSIRARIYDNLLAAATERQASEYVPLSEHKLPVAQPPVKLIAFYLPQFHPIPENDRWWGKGFTEWANVTRGVPVFPGHHQPRLPGELGFYDLRVPEVQMRQIELARQHGIHGFCFHFYWFEGRTLLEKPLQQFLASPEMDFPFCINWANENWTRRWDGMDRDVLIGQKHSPEDDLAFISHVSRYLRDPRYIKVGSRPLLTVYRPALLPDAGATARRWRRWCLDNGIGEIFLALVHAFEHLDPRDIGFDAAIEFPPNTFDLTDIKDRLDIANPRFSGQVFDYVEALERSREYRRPPYTKFRGLCPGWDNEARRPGRGTILTNSSPRAYAEWLKTLCQFTIRTFAPEERLIFVNAWNEWAEAAYLEPDRRYGYAYLTRTAEALASAADERDSSTGTWRILFVSHDACRGGAQAVLLNVLSWFAQHTYVDIRVLCLDGGEWLYRFRDLAATALLSEFREEARSEQDLAGRLLEFCGGVPDLVFGNTVAAGREYGLLRRLNAPIITHVNELQMSITRYAGEWINDVIRYSSRFIACSGAVRENLVQNYGVDDSIVDTVYSSIRPDTSSGIADSREKKKLREKLKLEANRCLIFGCGLGMPFRKGADLFIEVARILRSRGHDGFHMYWIGDFDRTESDERYGAWADHLKKIRADGLTKHVTFLGIKDDPRRYLMAGDIFLMPSREDPFPLLTLEAAGCGLPIVCFDGAGGMSEFVDEDCGFVVPFEDAEAMADKAVLLMQDERLRHELGTLARNKMLSRFTVEHTTPHILSACRRAASKNPTVSIIVPNYNHARYLPRRLDSIFSQTFKDFEVILLDDASNDGSVEVLERYAHHADVRIVRNEQNTGSPCAQWLKGFDLASADILWIAESDDASEPQFLETMLPLFCDPGVRMAYANSHVMDEDGRVVGDYLDSEYLTSLSRDKWRHTYQAHAADEINDGLGVKNTILNISAVLFRRFDCSDELRTTLQSMRIAGDWHFIVNAIKDGKIHYLAEKLNYHRRHSDSVIGGMISDKNVEGFFREFHMVQQFVFDNYRLTAGFAEKWERYLRKQWNDFFPGRPFEELKQYYPLDEMTEKLSKSPPSHEGVCPICGPTEFIIEDDWLRDHYRCSRCRSLPRWRALVYVLDTVYPHWRKSRIHESSPGGPASDKLRTECAGYSSSHFLPGVPPGQTRGGIRCEDLERLSFPDHSFDIFITQDVLEHVCDPAAAFREISRVLCPGGAHVFTVPCYRRDKSVARARRGIGGVEHLMPPEYHGNPVDPGGSLVITEWGRDIIEFIRDTAGMHTDVHTLRNREYGLDGEFLDVFISRKS